MKHINWAYENENSLHTSHVEQTERQTDGRTDSQTHPYFDHFIYIYIYKVFQFVELKKTRVYVLIKGNSNLM